MPNKSDKKKGLTTSHKLLSEDYKQQTEAIQSSEVRFRTMVDSLPFDVFLIGSDGRYVLQNAPCRNSWGDIIGKRPEDICKDKKTLALWKSNNRRAFKGETVEEEVSFKVKDEEKHYYNIISPIREKGKITGILGINIDITKRKQAGRVLIAEKEFTDTTLDALKDTFFVFDPKTGKAIRWNKVFSEVSGYSDDEIRSMKAPDSYYSKDDLKKVAAATEDLGKGETVVVEMSLINKNGKAIPTEYIGSALRDEKGNLKYIIAIGRDITKRRQAEEELRLLNDEMEQRVAERTAEVQRYRLVFQNAQDAIFWADPYTGVLVNCNKAAERLLEKSRNEIIGKHVTMLHPAEGKERYKAMFTEHVTKGGIQSDEVIIVTRSGKRVPIHVSSSVISVGGTTVIQGIFTDITERKKTEEELRLNNEMFKNVAEGIYLIGLDDGIIKWANARFEKMFGYEPGEMIGRDVSMVNAPTDKTPEETKREIVDILRKTGEWHGEVNNIKKDGTPFRCYANVSVFDHPEYGKVLVSVHTDITERKKVEEDIARQAKLLDLIFKYSLDSIVLLDKDYNFIWVSETYAKSCQRDSSEFAGHNHFEFYPSSLKEEFDAVKKGKSIYRQYARPFIFPDHPEWGETYWDLGLVPIFDDDGEIEMFLFTLKDITERMKSEEQLIQAKQRYRTVADFAYDWEWWRSPEGKYIYMSPSCERITGYKWDEFTNNPHLVDEVILPEDQEEWRKHNIEVQTAHKPVEVQFRIKRKDGCVRWIEHICQPVKDTDGEFMGFRASNRDITGRRQVEEEANRLRSEYLHIARVSAMGELTASLAHELKQPLAAIRSNAQAAQRFLAKEKPDLDELSEILADIVKDNRRADEVIGRLRTLMRKSELQIAELNINNVIQEIFPLIRSYEIMRNISLEFELDDKIPSVAGDRIQLQQVILNLIMNSSEALENIARDIRRIVIRTSQKNHNNVTVAIRDNGIGIDEQSLDSLFEPFYTTKQEGMGMGLPISRSIIEAHGGNLWAENNPDRGATFYFTIPVFQSSLA